MLDAESKYEILELDHGMSLLVLRKVTETGSPFIVVAGYFLQKVGKFEESVLAEIETVSEGEYSKLKDSIRQILDANEQKVPITFW